MEDLFYAFENALETHKVTKHILSQLFIFHTDMERAILRDLVCRVLQFLPQLTKAVNFAAELDWYVCFYWAYK
jgi:hypothetical protein